MKWRNTLPSDELECFEDNDHINEISSMMYILHIVK